MESKTIFVVSSGSYSDYGIDAMFETRALAEQYIFLKTTTGRFTCGDPEIEEWPLNVAPARVKYASAVMLTTGLIEVSPYLFISSEPDHPVAGQEEKGVVWGVAESPDAALKSALDHRARILAEREGIA